MKTARPSVVNALLAVLVLSIGLDALLAQKALDLFEAADAVRLDPAGLKVYAPRTKPPDDRPLLVFFGDSRAFMWPEPVGLSRYRVVNRGIGRQTTAQLLLRLDADVTALRPAVVIVEGGVNDLKTIADFPAQRAEITSDCKANLATIVDRCRGAGAEVVLVTVFDIGNVPLWRRALWSNEVEAAVREVNAFLPHLAGDKVKLFDADAALDERPGEIRRDYQLDHLHLSPAGYAALNERLVPFVSALPN